MVDVKEFENIRNEHRGVIVLHRNQTPNFQFEKYVEIDGYDRALTTKAVNACISNEIRAYMKTLDLNVTSIDLDRNRVEYEYDFFGTPIEDRVNFSFYSKSRWEATKQMESRNMIENGDSPYPESITVDPDQMTIGLLED